MNADEAWVYKGETNDPDLWHELDAGQLAVPDGPVLVRVWAKRFKSNSPDAERFIHDPLGMMVDAGVPDLTSDSTVTTVVTHHQRRLLKHPMIVVAIIALGTASVLVTIYKAP